MTKYYDIWFDVWIDWTIAHNLCIIFFSVYRLSSWASHREECQLFVVDVGRLWETNQSSLRILYTNLMLVNIREIKKAGRPLGCRRSAVIAVKFSVQNGMRYWLRGSRMNHVTILMRRLLPTKLSLIYRCGIRTEKWTLVSNGKHWMFVSWENSLLKIFPIQTWYNAKPSMRKVNIFRSVFQHVKTQHSAGYGAHRPGIFHMHSECRPCLLASFLLEICWQKSIETNLHTGRKPSNGHRWQNTRTEKKFRIAAVR